MEQDTVHSSEETKVETQETKVETQETITPTEMEESLDRAFDMFENGKFKEEGKPEVETEVETKDETEVKPEVETEDETKGEPELNLSELKVKYNGEEKPVEDVIKELYKSNPDILNDLQKRFDYTKKTQKVSEEQKFIEAEKERLLNETKAIVYENLANDIGAPKTEFDFLYKVDNEGNYVYNEEEAKKAYSDYLTDFGRKKAEYAEKLRISEERNQSMVDNFCSKYGFSPDSVDNEIIPELTQYINPATSKGLIPFPEDALEVFYKGKNFDKLMANEIDKAKKDERKKVLSEIENVDKKSKATPKVQTSKTIQTEKDEFDMAFDSYLKQ